MRSAAWDNGTLVLHFPLTDFTAALEYLDSDHKWHRIEDCEAFKAFIVEHAFRVSAFDDQHDGNVDTITEWIDLLMQLAAKKGAGIAIDRPRRKRQAK